MDCSIICDADGKIYTVSEGFNAKSYFHCLDNIGEILWEVFVDDISFIGSPAINSKGVIYIGGFTSSFNPYHTRNLIAISENPLEVEDEVRLNAYELFQNYPNPFNSSTTISYNIPKSTHVNVKVFDLMGQEIETMVNEFKEAGIHQVSFNASSLSSGIYFYRIQTGDFDIVKKMTLLK